MMFASSASSSAHLLPLLFLAAGALGFALAAKPPRARRQPRVREIHEVQLRDDYHWLREKDNPEVLRHLQNENSYTTETLAPTEQLQERLYQEMVGRIQETDSSVPYRQGPYYYYRRTEAGRQYPIYCRKRGSLDSAEEVVLDLNQIAVGRDYVSLGALEVSPDHRLVAYAIDDQGGEEYTLFIKDLEKGFLLPDRILRTADSVEWAGDNQTLFYSLPDAAHRPYRLMRHRLGTSVDRDTLVFQEDDEAFFLSLSKTRSQQYLLLELESNRSSEVRFLSAHDPEGEFRIIEPRRPKIEYAVDHRGEFFYLTTNDEALEFRLVRTPINAPSRENWEELIPHQPNFHLEEVLLFQDHMAVLQREKGLRTLRLYDFGRDEEGLGLAPLSAFRTIDFDEQLYTLSPEQNPEFRSPRVRLTYSSLIEPESVYDIDMATGSRELLKQDEVLGGFQASDYESRRLFAEARDGATIPISLVRRKDAAPPGSGSPLLLYGYGAYGLSIEPAFSSQRLSLLDRGVAFAIAHVRGGGDLGRVWYEEGKLSKKENTFGDFIACAEHLISEGITAPDRLAIMGGSAGGLLMGVAANRRPELFRAVVARVPFLDVVNTMLDPSLPLTVTEFEEWGDPREASFFNYLKSYSPYENVRRQAYPAMLLTAGLNDPRVPYWEPAKWLARLRELKTDAHVQLLHTTLDSGHAGASGRYRRLRETAMIYAFLLRQLAIDTGDDSSEALEH